MENKRTSRIELLTREVFNFYLPEEIPIYNYRPEWMKNPETNKPLELDIFYPDLGLAVEINGAFHLLKYQKYKDGIKRSACEEQDIFLVVIRGKKELLKVAQTLKYFFENNNIEAPDRLPPKLYYQIKKYRASKTAFSTPEIAKTLKRLQKEKYSKKKKIPRAKIKSERYFKTFETDEERIRRAIKAQQEETSRVKRLREIKGL